MLAQSQISHEPICKARIFTSLFVHGLEHSAALDEALRKAGFDTTLLADVDYPMSVLARCLEAAVAHRAQGLSVEEAYVALGVATIKGLTATVVGKMITVGMRLSGPDQVLRQVPLGIRNDYSLAFSCTLIEAGRYALRPEGAVPEWFGPFLKGVVDEALRLTGVVPMTSIRRDGLPGGLIIDITWSAAPPEN